MLKHSDFDLTSIYGTAHRKRVTGNRGIRYFLPDQSSLASVRVQTFVKKTMTPEQKKANVRLSRPRVS